MPPSTHAYLTPVRESGNAATRNLELNSVAAGNHDQPHREAAFRAASAFHRAAQRRLHTCAIRSCMRFVSSDLRTLPLNQRRVVIEGEAGSDAPGPEITLYVTGFPQSSRMPCCHGPAARSHANARAHAARLAPAGSEATTGGFSGTGTRPDACREERRSSQSPETALYRRQYCPCTIASV